MVEVQQASQASQRLESSRVIQPLVTRRFARGRMLEVLISVPYLVVALMVPYQQLSIETKNALLVASMDTSTVASAGELDPTVVGIIPQAIAFLLPTAQAELILAILGCLLAGRLLRLLGYSLWQEHTSPVNTVVLVGALAVSPALFFLAVTNFSVMLAVTLFAYGVRGALRLAIWNDTSAGFGAGFALLMAVLSDPIAILCALMLAIAAPLLEHAREDIPGAKRANVTIMLFPLTAALVMWGLSELIFYRAYGAVERFLSTLTGAEDRFMSLVDLAQRPAGLIIFGPLMAAILLTFALRHRAVPLGAALVMLVITGSFVVGLITLADSGITFVLTLIMGILLFPRPTARWASAVQGGVLVLLVAAAWWGSWDNARMQELFQAVVQV